VTTAGGVFVVFEGGDGVGKTTQVDRLCAWLAKAGRSDDPPDCSGSGNRGDVAAR
jgi:hypothetical protein